MEKLKIPDEKKLANKFLSLIEDLELEPDGASVNMLMELAKYKDLSVAMSEIEEIAGEVASLWIPYDEENREKARKLFIDIGDKFAKITSKP